jgi:hypothetical protein
MQEEKILKEKKIPRFFPFKKQNNNIQKCKESNKTTKIYKQQQYLKLKKRRI